MNTQQQKKFPFSSFVSTQEINFKFFTFSFFPPEKLKTFLASILHLVPK
jgi:hypothetical protein